MTFAWRILAMRLVSSAAWSLSRARRTARSMIGLPSYRAYLSHMEREHPERRPMDYATFFRNRQDARYGAKGGGRCC